MCSAGSRETKHEQTQLDFATAEGRHNERLALAVLAVARLPANRRWDVIEKNVRASKRPTIYRQALLRLVFDATGGGEPGADPLRKSYADLADLLFCDRRTVIRTAGAAVRERLLRIVADENGNGYAVDWLGMFSRMGVPAECMVSGQAPHSTSDSQSPPGDSQSPPSDSQSLASGGFASPDIVIPVGRPESSPPRARANEYKETKESKALNLPTYQHKESMTNGPAPVPISQALAEALQSFGNQTTAAAQKNRLMSRIHSVVPEAAEWLAGKAADLVVFLGVAPSDLDAVLRDVTAMRSTGKLDKPAGLFYRLVERMAQRHGLTIAKGKPCPNSPPTARSAASR